MNHRWKNLLILTICVVVQSPAISAATTQPCLQPVRSLWIGTKGDDVRALQEYLRTTGDYTYGEITGYFGRATEAAVQRFQSRNGIVSSGDAASTGFGVVGAKTRATLQAGCTTTSTVTTPIPSSALSLSRSLWIGTKGDDVRALQEYLRTTGDYTYGEITGYFGRATEAAVQRFQSRNGIVSSGDAASTGFGVVGAKTRLFLTVHGGVVGAAPSTPPVSPPPSGGGSGGGGITAPVSIINGGGSATNSSGAGSSTVTTPATTPSSTSGGTGAGTSISTTSATTTSATSTNTTSATTTSTTTGSGATSTTSPATTTVMLDANGCFGLAQLSATEASAWLSLPSSELQNKILLTYKLNPSCLSYLPGSTTNHTAHLRLGAALSSLMNREFRLAAGNYSVSAPISLSSNARISGTGSTTITVGANQVSSIFKIESSATAVALKNLILKEGGGLSTGHLSLEGGNSNIVIDQVRFVGDTTKGSITAAAIRAPRELVSNVTVNNSIFEYMPYGFSSNANVTDLTITNSDFSGWTHYAILISPGSASTGTRSERITINSNYFHHPDVGPDGQALLLITRGTSRQYVQTVTINRNRVDGPGVPYYPNPKPAGSSNALGDLFVLHGVNGFTIDSNIMQGGSENGISVTRLSRNGTISNNELFDMDAFAINIGSGYYEVTVDSTANLHIGDTVKGAVSGTESPIVAIIGNVLGLNPVAYNIFRNEALNNLTTGQNNAATITAVDRTKVITIDNNKIYNNGRNRAQELGTVWEVIVMHSDSIDFHRNNIYSTIHQPKTSAYNTFVINNSRNIGVYDDNVIQNGAFSPTEVITRNSATWLKGE